jgi:hypothetical protein
MSNNNFIDHSNVIVYVNNAFILNFKILLAVSNTGSEGGREGAALQGRKIAL